MFGRIEWALVACSTRGRRARVEPVDVEVARKAVRAGRDLALVPLAERVLEAVEPGVVAAALAGEGRRVPVVAGLVLLRELAALGPYQHPEAR